MTVEQLDKANKLQKEIEQINDVFDMLDSTIQYAESRSTPMKKILRFLNCSLKHGENKKAHTILFIDDQMYGRDIPVDLDFLKYLRSYFKDRLDDKTNELGEI